MRERISLCAATVIVAALLAASIVVTVGHSDRIDALEDRVEHLIREASWQDLDGEQP